MHSPDIANMIAEIRNLADSLPSRIPSLLRVGPYVRELLRLGSADGHGITGVGLPLGVTVYLDDTYAPGEWRLFDQWSEALHEGQIEALRGLGAGLTIRVSEHLPPGVAAVLIAPTNLHPDDPDYQPIERRAAIIREQR